MKLEGAMTALVTPMRKGEIDFPALERLVDHQIESGIDGLVAVGTTGESATLSVDEHVHVVRCVVQRAAGKVPVVAGAGANATYEAIELSKACQAAGADGLLHVTPYYNKPTQRGLLAHFRAIAEACDLPIILYNVPSRTACDLLPDTVAELAQIDHIVAIKDATGCPRRASDILARVRDDLCVLSGDDFTTLALYAVGARGVISVISNIMPTQMAQMWDAVVAGDWAKGRMLHAHMMPLTELLFRESNPTGIKAALALIGAIEPDMRLPLVPCSQALQDQLRSQLSADGLL